MSVRVGAILKTRTHSSDSPGAVGCPLLGYNDVSDGFEASLLGAGEDREPCSGFVRGIVETPPPSFSSAGPRGLPVDPTRPSLNYS
jgi:hypothetical protein